MDQQILDRIRKLLALAQDSSATPGEAEAALGRIAHLQATYGITDEQIRQHTYRTSDGSIHIDAKAVREQVLKSAGRIGRWDAWSASAAATAVGCKIYFVGGRGDSRIVAYGLPADLAVCAELFAFALKAGERAQIHYCIDNHLMKGSRESKAFRDGFCQGLQDAAARAAKTARESAETVPVSMNQVNAQHQLVVVETSMAVVAKAKSSAVAEYAQTQLNLRGGKSFQSYSGYGSYYVGRAAGQATNLSLSTLR